MIYKHLLTRRILLLLSGILIVSMVNADDFPKLLVDFEKVKLNVEETYQLPSVLDYVESEESDTVEVEVLWQVLPDTLGSIDDLFVFTAEKPGEGMLLASYDTISQSVEIEIENEEEEDDGDEFPKLLLSFKKVKLDTSEIYQLPSMIDYVENEESDTVEVEVQWQVQPDSLGSIDDFLVFTAEKQGKGYLHVIYELISDSVELEIEVKDEETDEEYPKVKIIPGSAKVELGDSLELYAFYADSVGIKTDTTFAWSVEPLELGTFPDPQIPVFQTSANGSGIIIAKLGELADTIHVKVYEGRWKKADNNKGKKISIVPGDTIVMADAGMVQYSAYYEIKPNDEEAEILWSVADTSIATIDSYGLLALKGTTGLTLVSAKYRNFKTSVELLVIDPSVDPVVNTITIHRVLPNGKVLNPKVFKEGESYKIGGLPYPLNILNAGMLHFPFGCISEDITIYMTIPEEYATINDEETEVILSDNIINGVEFNVQPASSDAIVHPFWFDVPVELRMVYKKELLDSLNIEPQNLDVFFAENAQFIPVDDGVATVDSASNLIYASIEHFSTIVIREKSGLVKVENIDNVAKDQLFAYPNPFNLNTRIRYSVEKDEEIQIDIYNINGQNIKVLVNESKAAGEYNVNWDGTTDNGGIAQSGVYFCRMLINGERTVVKRIVLNR